MWIFQHIYGRTSIALALGSGSCSLCAMVLVAGVPAFLAAALLYYTFLAINQPVQQMLRIRKAGESSKATVSGLCNTARSLGLMVVPLYVGIADLIFRNFPFVGAATASALCAVLFIYNARQFG